MFKFWSLVAELILGKCESRIPFLALERKEKESSFSLLERTKHADSPFEGRENFSST